MKKIFAYMVVALALTSVSVWAKAALETDIFDFKQGAFTFKENYTLNDLAVRLSTNSGVISLNNLTEIGFYKIASMTGHSTTLDGEPVWMHTNNNGAITINPNAPVTFEEGDTIGIYVKTNGYMKKQNGNWVWVEGERTFTTTDNAIAGADSLKNNERPEEDNGFTYFSLYLDNNDIKQPTYQYALKGEVNNGGGGSTGGQPLPGLLMTLTLGGMAVAGMSRKRKNSKA